MTDSRPQPPLHAVPDDTATIRPVPPVRDTPAHEPLRPVLPDWLRSRENLRSAAHRRARHELHRAAYHGTRSPAYLAKTVFWGVAGTGWLFLLWMRWWLSPVPLNAHQQAAQEGWRSWKTIHAVHRKTTKTRAWISLAVLAAAGIAGRVAWAFSPWALAGAGGALVVVAAAVARPEGARIVTPHVVPAELEKLTQDVIVRALGSLGIAGIDRWLREDKQIVFPHPVRQDGPGWRAEVDLPYGVTATQVIERREQLASGLRRPLGAVWPEPATSEHAGRLELFVGQQDITSRRPVPYPLLKSGTADVFKPVPAGTDVRGRPVKAPLIYHNWLVGSMPRNGKTGTVRELNAAISLDPLARMWVHDLKGTGDLDPFELLCDRFVSGIDDESVAYAAESLAKLRTEVERRSPKIKRLPTSICPDKRLTRQIAEKHRDLRPIGCTIDECQNLFANAKYGKQAGADAEFIIKVGPAMGVFLILATQRPDKESLPTGVSGNVSIRFCLYVAGQVENDMILGTSAYKNGVRATMFRPEIDAGLGYLKGATPAPKVVKTYYMNVPETQAVVARARVLRERAGTLPAEDGDAPERDVLADALAAMDTDPGLHWEVLAERLAQRWPERWGGTTKEALRAMLGELGVPSVTVSMGGQILRGCRKQALEQAAAQAVNAQVSGSGLTDGAR
jgi:DNA segregation ATPase FtsK/SpoIIIE, S-DNA-T family